MARGWESKSIEEQIDLTRAEKDINSKPRLTDVELQRKARRRGFLTSRARILRDLEAAKEGRYRDMLERSLAHVEEELRRLNAGDGS
jgi:hypothetical protein